MRKAAILKILRNLSIFVLIFAWVYNFSLPDYAFWKILGGQGWLLVFAEEIPFLTTTTSTSTNEIITQPQIDEESAPEENAPEEIEEIVPSPELSPPNLPPLKERVLNKNFRIAQTAAHRCNAETFRIDVSGKTSAQARIMLGGKKVQSGEIEIGSLPLGIDIQFSDGRDYLRGVSQNDGAFDLGITSQNGSEKGNFSIPILYTDKETNQTTICQINIINF